jgi:hypothetical protein
MILLCSVLLHENFKIIVVFGKINNLLNSKALQTTFGSFIFKFEEGVINLIKRVEFDRHNGHPLVVW